MDERGPPLRMRVRASPRPIARTGDCVFAKPLCPPLCGRSLEFGSGRHAGWAVFTVFSFSTPRRRVLVGPSRIDHSGERGWFVKRAVSLFLRNNRWLPTSLA